VPAQYQHRVLFLGVLGALVARAIMPMSVTFDHRVIDGEQGLTFALTLRELIEDPKHLGNW